MGKSILHLWGCLRRKVRLDSRRENQKITRDANGIKKRAENARRDARVIAKIKTLEHGNWSGEIKSWLARRFDKKPHLVTPEEIASLG